MIGARSRALTNVDHRSLFERGLRGERSWLRRGDGEIIPLAVRRWATVRGGADRWVLNRCAGPTIDLGCGPGRFAEALARSGVPTLGVDISPVAVQQTTTRGGVALQRDVLDRLPGEGRWHHALLIDGNVGIGGDPTTLLDRTRRLVRPGGHVVVETCRPGTGSWRGAVRLESSGILGPWFPWATIALDTLAELAAERGFEVTTTGVHGGRWFADLRTRGERP